MKVLICGSRGWEDYERLRHHLSGFPRGTVFIHGGARGADRLVDLAVRDENLEYDYEYETEVFYADWETHGKRAGILRNIEMLDEQPDLVVAFWDGESKGTKHTIEEAGRRGIPVEVVSP